MLKNGNDFYLLPKEALRRFPLLKRVGFTDQLLGMMAARDILESIPMPNTTRRMLSLRALRSLIEWVNSERKGRLINPDDLKINPEDEDYEDLGDE